MANIGGYTAGTVQTIQGSEKNAIGEMVNVWTDFVGIIGWLGLQSGDSKYTNHSAKVEESTHTFLCDFNSSVYALTLPGEKGTIPQVRMIIKGMVYDVLLIDNPDEMDEQLEIYLRKVGAWNGNQV